MAKLKDIDRCPFCKSNELKLTDGTKGAGYGAQFVQCKSCGACGPTGFNGDAAINKWNQRYDTVDKETDQ